MIHLFAVLAMAAIVAASLGTPIARLVHYKPTRPLFTVSGWGHPDDWPDATFAQWQAGTGYLGSSASFSLRMFALAVLYVLARITT